MGCGGSKPATGPGRSASRRYLAGVGPPSGPDGFIMAAGELYDGMVGPLTARDYKERLVTSEGTQSITLPRAGYSIRYAYVSQRGYYPDAPHKANQDAFCVHTAFNGDPEQQLFGVFDGHGDAGTHASQFARDRVPLNLLSSAHFASNPALAFHQALVATNLQCHRAEFDDSMSGTTAICVLVRGRSLLVANVGDSRAVLAERVPQSQQAAAAAAGAPGGFIARDLSIDQTPYRRDEAERVKACGARVLTLDQIEGLKDPTLECWTTEEDDDGDPPRLWFPNGMYPGTAFTRSIGDAAAERIGVFAEPELEYRHLGQHDAFLVIASDGVFEFISSQRVVDMVAKFDDPYEACLSVVAESYRRWLQYETRTDDITMVVLQFSGLDEKPPPQLAMASSAFARSPTPPGLALAPSVALSYNTTSTNANGGQQQQLLTHPLPSGDLLADGGASGAFAAAAATPLPRPADRTHDAMQSSYYPHHHTSHALSVPMRGHLVEDIEPSGDGRGESLTAAASTLVNSPSTWAGTYSATGASAATGLASGAAAAAAAKAALAPGGSQHVAGTAVGAVVLGAGGRQASLDLQGAMSQQQFRMLEESVRTNFLFAHLSEAERLLVYKVMQRVEVEPGQVVIHQGEQGDHFYVVEQGTFDVMVSTPLPDGHQQEHAAQVQAARQAAHAAAAAAAQQQQLERQQSGAGIGGGTRGGGEGGGGAGGTPPPSLRTPDGKGGGGGGGGVVSPAGSTVLSPADSCPTTGRASSVGSAATGRGVLIDNDLMADIAATAADERLLSALGEEEAAAAMDMPLPSPAGSTGGGGGGGGGDSAAAGGASPEQQQQPAVGLLGGIKTQWGELVHTYIAPPLSGPEAGGPHPSFGELALLYGKPRAATVVAQTRGVLWRVSRDDFRRAVASGRADPGALVLRTLRSVELLECLTVGQLALLAGMLQPHLYDDGEVIAHQGDPCDEFCIVAQGVVAAVVRKGGNNATAAAAASADGGGTGSPGAAAAAAAAAGREHSVHGGREVLTMGPGAYFGDRGLLEAHPRPASMVARGQVLLLVVSRAAFEALVGSLAQLRQDHAAWRAWLAAQAELLGRTTVLGPKHAELLAGNFDPQRLQLAGCLWPFNEASCLASLVDPGQGLSLTGRLVSVEGIEARGWSATLVRARGLTAELPPCLFVPHTLKTWRSPPRGSGPRAPPAAVAGEALATVGVCTLAALLQDGPLDERSASYVTAMAMLGIGHLHRLGLTYRGLSALTLLVAEGGLVQLVDFRFARRSPDGGRCYTLCGVPEYLAPEVVGGTGHDESSDWWALGVLAYHLVTGGTPFAQLGDDELRIYRRITRGAYSWPDTPAGHDISADARDLVQQLLQRDPARRLGMGRGGLPRLRAHPWFRAIDWQDLQEGRSAVPLGLRERLLSSAGGGELAPWAAAPRRPGAQDPSWLDAF